jgi:hypothetical protein
MRGAEERNVAFSLGLMPRRASQAEQCTVAHDLNNCVSTILGQCELLVDLLLDHDEAMKRVSIIAQTARRLANDIEVRSCPISSGK